MEREQGFVNTSLAVVDQTLIIMVLSASMGGSQSSDNTHFGRLTVKTELDAVAAVVEVFVLPHLSKVYVLYINSDNRIHKLYGKVT